MNSQNVNKRISVNPKLTEMQEHITKFLKVFTQMRDADQFYAETMRRRKEMNRDMLESQWVMEQCYHIVVAMYHYQFIKQRDPETDKFIHDLVDIIGWWANNNDKSF